MSILWRPYEFYKKVIIYTHYEFLICRIGRIVKNMSILWFVKIMSILWFGRPCEFYVNFMVCYLY